jgi:BASS family bile acid:Na+ symporter
MDAPVTLQQLSSDVFSVALFVMLITLVSGLGMGFAVSQLFATMRRWQVVLAALAINCLLVPIVTWVLCSAFPVSPEARIGLVLACMSSGGPAGLKAAQLAKRADMALAVSLTVILQLANIVVAPLWAQAVVPGASVSAGTVIVDLLVLVLVPLLVGLFIHARYTEHATGWRIELEKISNLALYVAIVTGIAANWEPFISQVGSWTIFVSILLVLLFMGLGALIGLRDRPTAIAGATVTAMRFTPLGMIVIATQLDNNSAYLAPTLVMGLVTTFLVIGAGAEIGRRGAQGAHVVVTPTAAAA